MPDKVALKFYQLKMIIVHLGDDPGRTVIGKFGEFFGKVNRLIRHDWPSASL
jgi:hypothetical protein